MSNSEPGNVRRAQSPAAPTQRVVRAEVLKAYMQKKGLTQQGLADVTHSLRRPVSIATIKRLCSARTEPTRTNANTIEALAQALRIRPEELTAADAAEITSEKQANQDRVRISALVDEDVELSYQAVEKIYGISRQGQIALAPLFTALLAEQSLKWRTERLEELKTVGDQLDRLRSTDPVLTSAYEAVWESEDLEEAAIAQKDICGTQKNPLLAGLYKAIGHANEKTLDSDPWANPFLYFLEHVTGSLKGCDLKLYSSSAEGYLPVEQIDYLIGDELFEQRIGVMWGHLAVRYGWIRVSEIPEEMMSDEISKEEKISFFRSKIRDYERVNISIKTKKLEIEQRDPSHKCTIDDYVWQLFCWNLDADFATSYSKERKKEAAKNAFEDINAWRLAQGEEPLGEISKLVDDFLRRHDLG